MATGCVTRTIARYGPVVQISGHELGEELEARAERLPLDARLLLALGAIQRCDAFYRHSIDEYPDRARYVSAVDRGLALAWATAEGRSVDPAESALVTDELRSFSPKDPYDPVLAGDRSWSIMTEDGLANALDLRDYPDVGIYATTMLGAPRNLVLIWYQWAEMAAGRTTNVAEMTSTSAYLLELAVQARHVEWFRHRPVDAALVRRVRADSMRVGKELVAIVGEWRKGQ
jgi:hypothetical protein